MSLNKISSLGIYYQIPVTLAQIKQLTGGRSTLVHSADLY